MDLIFIQTLLRRATRVSSLHTDKVSVRSSAGFTALLFRFNIQYGWTREKKLNEVLQLDAV